MGSHHLFMGGDRSQESGVRSQEGKEGEGKKGKERPQI